MRDADVLWRLQVMVKEPPAIHVPHSFITGFQTDQRAKVEDVHILTVLLPSTLPTLVNIYIRKTASRLTKRYLVYTTSFENQQGDIR